MDIQSQAPKINFFYLPPLCAFPLSEDNKAMRRPGLLIPSSTILPRSDDDEPSR